MDRPTPGETEELIRTFFGLLKVQQLERAEQVVEHAYSDWPYQIWSLWQYLVADDMDADDSAYQFEARTWERDLSWLKGIDILEDKFHWDESGEHLFVNVSYNGEITDASADFRVELRDRGWVVVREIIHVA